MKRIASAEGGHSNDCYWQQMSFFTTHFRRPKFLAIMAFICAIPHALGQVSVDIFSKPDSDLPYTKGKLEGLWTCSSQNPIATCYKHFYLGKMYVVVVDPTTNVILNAHVGPYSETNDTLREKPRFVMTTSAGSKDQLHHWRLGFSGDSIYSQQSLSVNFKQVWSKVAVDSRENTLQAVTDFSDQVSQIDGIWYRTWTGGGAIRVMDKGRWFYCEFPIDTRIINKSTGGLYSLNQENVLRQKVSYASESLKSDLGALHLARVEASKESYRQTNADGSTETWKRWGQAPERLTSPANPSSPEPRKTIQRSTAGKAGYVDIRVGESVAIHFDELPATTREGVYGMATIAKDNAPSERRVAFVKTASKSKTEYRCQIITSRLFEYHDGANGIKKCQGYEEIP